MSGIAYVVEIGLDKGSDGFWDLKVVKSSPEEIVGNSTKSIGRVQEHDVKISSISFHGLDLISYHVHVFQTHWVARDLPASL